MGSLIRRFNCVVIDCTTLICEWHMHTLYCKKVPLCCYWLYKAHLWVACAFTLLQEASTVLLLIVQSSFVSGTCIHSISLWLDVVTLKKVPLYCSWLSKAHLQAAHVFTPWLDAANTIKLLKTTDHSHHDRMWQIHQCSWEQLTIHKVTGCGKHTNALENNWPFTANHTMTGCGKYTNVLKNN